MVEKEKQKINQEPLLEERKKKKKRTMVLVTSLLGILLLLGLSYAWLSLTIFGNKTAVVRSGSLSLKLDETSENGILLKDAVPVYDEIGLKNDPYTFTLENDGTIESSYEIYLDDMELEEGEVRVNDSALRYQLCIDGNCSDPQNLPTMGSHPERLLDSGNIAPGVANKKSYSLRIWMSTEASNEAMAKVFRAKLRVVGEQATKKMVAAISSGNFYTMILTNGGDLYAVGSNNFGRLGNGTTDEQMNPVKVATDVKNVVAGFNHTMFIKNNGDLYGMGYNGNGQLGDGTTENKTTPVKVASHVASVSVGPNYTMYITDNNELYGMGINGYGQLGDGTTESKSTPVKIRDDVDSVSCSVSLYDYATTFVTKSNELYSMGHQVATLSGSIDTITPVKITDGVLKAQAYSLGQFILTNEHKAYYNVGDGLKEITGVPYDGSIKDFFLTDGVGNNPSAMFLADNNDLYVYGYSNRGNLGSGNTGFPSGKLMGNVRTVSLGPDHTFIFTKDGKIHGTGDNTYGQLGTGLAVNVLTPTKLDESVTSMYAFSNHSLVVKNYRLYAYGMDDVQGETRMGQLFPESENIEKAVSGYEHMLLLEDDGESDVGLSLYTVGENANGQLGDGTTQSKGTPARIMTNVLDINVGDYHSMVIDSNSALYGFGKNDKGQLGDGTTTDKSSPVKIMDNVKSVSSGANHTMIVTKNGDLYGVGSNSNGQLGDGTKEDKTSPVKIMSNVKMVSSGGNYTLFVTTNNELYGMGQNTSYQLGDGTRENKTSPVKIADNVQWAFAGTINHSLFITTSNELYGMGSNSKGQLGIGNRTTQKVPVKIMDQVSGNSVSLGQSHSFVKVRNTLYGFGSNEQGQLGKVSSPKTPVEINFKLK